MGQKECRSQPLLNMDFQWGLELKLPTHHACVFESQNNRAITSHMFCHEIETHL